MNTLRIILLTALVVCAIATATTKNILRAVIVYMAYSVIMAVVWILLESPDLAITEAAVGAGITGLLMFLTLGQLRLIDRDEEHRKNDTKEEQAHED